jgi:Uma2 family endonuclease
MSTVLAEPFTAAEYYEMPEGGPRFQLIEGELCMSPSPNRQHQKLIANLFLALGNHVRERDLGEVYFSPFDVELDVHNVYQPDLCFFSHARERHLTKQGASGPPDFVIEILSPKTAKFDRQQKLHNYARAGVREYWIVDPATRSVTVHLLESAPTATPATHSDPALRLTAQAVPGFTVSLADVFAE